MRKPSPAMVVALASLFIALGGVAVAATGGTFILGQSNAAGSSTGLSAPVVGGKTLQLTNADTTNASSAALGLTVASGHAPMTVSSAGKVKNLNADQLDGIDSTGFVRNHAPITVTGPGGEDVLTAKNSGNGRGLAGYSDTWQGVYGHSNANAGVVGESLNFDGMYGVSESATHAAVSGHNGFGGWGVWASGGDVANGTSAIHGESSKGNGLDGVSQSSIASGVYGENDSTGYGLAGRANYGGTAVYGESTNGWALKANGNATQALKMGGLVKAMAYIEPGTSDPIRQCFNSQLPANKARAGNCNLVLTVAHQDVHLIVYRVDFGFYVADRFVSLTPTSLAWLDVASTESPIQCGQPGGYCSAVEVDAYNALSTDENAGPFYLYVY